MPYPTKTPDPPAPPPGCNASGFVAQCYRRGYQDGYMKGYENAYHDYRTGHPDQRIASNQVQSARAGCRGGDKEDCYKSGYTAGYNDGYASAALDAS